MMSDPFNDLETVTVRCSDCDYTGKYTPTNDGRIPDPCPECSGDLVKA